MENVLLINLKGGRDITKRIETCARNEEVEDLLDNRKVKWLLAINRDNTHALTARIN